MSGEIIEGQLQPPKPTGDAAVLAAFREVTDWTDQQILHFAECSECDPWPTENQHYCPEGRRLDWETLQHPPYGEPVRPHAPLQGTAGGPCCGVCGAPIDDVPIPAYPGDATTVPGSCPNSCDPREP